MWRPHHVSYILRRLSVIDKELPVKRGVRYSRGTRAERLDRQGSGGMKIEDWKDGRSIKRVSVAVVDRVGKQWVCCCWDVRLRQGEGSTAFLV